MTNQDTTLMPTKHNKVKDAMKEGGTMLILFTGAQVVAAIGGFAGPMEAALAASICAAIWGGSHYAIQATQKETHATLGLGSGRHQDD